MHAVYGPYEDDAAVQAAIARMWPGNKSDEYLVFDGQIMKLVPSAKEKPEAEKRAPGNLDRYTKINDVYVCKDCDANVLVATVAHPIWERGMAGGSGECRYEQVPYCPNCEKKPGYHGAPIHV
jgi:rubrerythrin